LKQPVLFSLSVVVVVVVVVELAWHFDGCLFGYK
jgi:hypothetical protein